MKIHLKPSLLKVRRQSVKWLIVHHTAEMYHQPEAKIDNAKFQMPALVSGVHIQKQGDINYHYVIDKIKEDYWPIVTRPIAYKCEWDDIHPDINNRAVHIAVLGSYDVKVPITRLYEVLAYRLLNPMLKLFAIPPSKIKLHRDVSSNEDLSCPGDFFDHGKLITLVRRYVIK
jgi:hypothetical protein